MRDRWLGGVLAVHVVLRVGLWLGGVGLSTLPLTGYWQTADLELLRSEPLTTLWHLHAQPPLWNTFVAVVEQLPVGLHHPTFRVALFLAGLAVVVAVAVLGRRLGLERRAAAVLALLVSVSPTLLGYELFVFYTLPVAAMVVGVVVLADQWDRSMRVGWLGAAVGLAASVALTRSLFHVGWVIVVATVVALWPDRAAGWRPDRRTIVVAALPVVVVLAWYGRVAALTGDFTSSTWLGMSLAKVTVPHLAPGELASLVDDGVVDPIALVPPFQAPYHYAPYVELPGPTGVQLLDRVATSNGVRNLHNLGVVPVGRAYEQAAGQIIRARPGVLVTQVATASCFFLRPGHASSQVEAAYGALDGWRRVWDRAVLLQARPDLGRSCDLGAWTAAGAASTSPTAVLLVLAPIALGLAALWRRARGRATTGDLALVVMGMTVGYVAVVSALVELGENYRFRFLVEPLGWVALAVVAQRAARAWRRRPAA